MRLFGGWLRNHRNTNTMRHRNKECNMDPKKRPHGKHAKGWTSPQVAEGLRLVEQGGMSWRKAAKQAGCGTSAMWAARKRLEQQHIGGDA